MTPENRQQFEAALVGLGLPVEALDRMEPWMAALTLSLLPLLRQGYQTESGVEMALAARAGGKQRGALETIAQQIDLFDGMPMDAQLTFLDKTVEAMPEAKTSLDAMVAEWIEGDADGARRAAQRRARRPGALRAAADRSATPTGRSGSSSGCSSRARCSSRSAPGTSPARTACSGSSRKRGLKVERIWQ